MPPAPSDSTTPIAPQLEQSFESKLTDKVEYVKVNEQKTSTDKNNKKRIQPAMMVRKDEVQKMASTNSNSLISQMMNMQGTGFQFSSTYEPLRLKPLRMEIRLFRVCQKTYLEVKKLQNHTVLHLVEAKDLEKMIIS